MVLPKVIMILPTSKATKYEVKMALPKGKMVLPKGKGVLPKGKAAIYVGKTMISTRFFIIFEYIVFLNAGIPVIYTGIMAKYKYILSVICCTFRFYI